MISIEQTRLRLSGSTDPAKKARLGQFFTSAGTAAFMASLFPEGAGDCRLLDAGAGIGSLSAAFLERWRAGALGFDTLALDAFEIDDSLHPYLAETVGRFHGGDFTARIRGDDFIEAASGALVGDLFAEPLGPYTHVILNPPYKKIGSQSAHRRLLRRAGIETVNLYSAFVALALGLTAPGGQLVAILPRSFCNGPYYRPFREFLLDRAAIRHIHLFESRRTAFRDDRVLQENLIIRLERGAPQGAVRVSTSTDDSFGDLESHEQPFERIVAPDDPERFIHVPTVVEESPLARFDGITRTLAALGLTVSTGPVVDFRLKAHLRAMPEPGTVPLLYPAHFGPDGATWPIEGQKKPNAIARTPESERWLFPLGFYCVVRRFSAKEERRRVRASVVDPALFAGAEALGFENHLNLFHAERQGLPAALAHGLAAYLNTTAVDEHFRRFNGHTQVNATDLRQLRYPSRERLMALGEWAMQQETLSQELIDAAAPALTA